MKNILFLLICFLATTSFAQTISAPELLEKSIQYHDPQGNWESFNGEFKIVMDMPGKPERTSVITLNLPEEYFNLSEQRDGKESFRELNGDDCRFSDAKGEDVITKTNDEQCVRTVMMKNYYTYLYGLPMKLKDPGTILDPEVKKVRFNDKEYLLLRVTYDEAVGSDIWQFYFNPKTYAMEVYQFFKGEDEKTGEYILLSDELEVNGIKMPKDRAWYYNKDGGYLATDRLAN
tara:strand:- start:733 stop:1428 length:696 start_codon:yes stop_codon:yes gene_type:complete